MRIKSIQVKIAELLVRRYNLSIQKNSELKKHEILESTLAIWSEWALSHPNHQLSSINIIIFSRDRVLQLDGLLRSIKLHFHGEFNITLIYSFSSGDFRSAYESCIENHSDIITHDFIDGISESFEQILKNILSKLTGTHVLFLVDDIVFIRDFHLSDISEVDAATSIVSLRLGQTITRCYMHNVPLSPPPLIPLNENGTLLSWTWKDGLLDWNYPLSLDGNIFLLEEINILIQSVPFRKPNSLEQNLQIFQPLFGHRQGLCFRKPVLVNNPANKVQTENNNRSGSMDVRELLVLWEAGYRIDVSSLTNMNSDSCHTEFTYPLIKL